MPKLEDAVIRRDDGWAFQCPRTDGTCAPFTSTGWPTKASAVARLTEHEAEHTDRTPMSDLHDFREKHGLTLNADGSVSA